MEAERIMELKALPAILVKALAFEKTLFFTRNKSAILVKALELWSRTHANPATAPVLTMQIFRIEPKAITTNHNHNILV